MADEQISQNFVLCNPQIFQVIRQIIEAKNRKVHAGIVLSAPAPESSKQHSFLGHMASVDPKRRMRGVRGAEDRRQRRRDWVGNGEQVSPPQPLGGAYRKLSPAKSGAKPRRKTTLLISKRARTPLVATFVASFTEPTAG